MLSTAAIEDFKHSFIPYDNDDKSVESLFLGYIYLNLSRGSTLDNLRNEIVNKLDDINKLDEIVNKIEDRSALINDLGLSILNDVVADHVNIRDSVYTEKFQSYVTKFKHECTGKGKSDDSFTKAELAVCVKLADLLVVCYKDSPLRKKQNL